MRKKIEEHKLNALVDSAGTIDNHIGQAPDPRSVSKAAEKGIDISMLRGRQFTVADFDNFDAIYVMDASNYSNVLALARNKQDVAKVEMLLNVSKPGSNTPVPDPYYGDGDGFEKVYNLIDEACEAIAQKLK
jgi:protein-tyrosine phosphatase